MIVKTLSVLRALAVCAATAAAWACGGSSSSSGPPTLTLGKAASASGDAQTDTVLGTLPNPLRVVATLGTSSQPGDMVTWAALGAGATVNPLTSVTDASGLATTTWTLGHTAGGQTATATLSGATGSPVTFTATATPGAATQITQPSGDGQQGMIGTMLAQPLAVTVADRSGNGVAGTAIAWAVVSGSASVNPTNAISNASGIAQTTVTLGATAGPISITATKVALAGSPQSFTATAQPIPTTAAVSVGPGIIFTSQRNLSQNAAVDTIAVGGKVTWTWAAGSIGHSVRSTGSPSFTSSMTQTSGIFPFTFTVAGSYTYDCAVHGGAMSGVIVVR